MRWLRSLDPADLRRHVTDRSGDDPIIVLSNLTGEEALIFWGALNLAEQLTMARRRPDLVAYQILANGGRVSGPVQQVLDDANAHGRLTERFDVDASLEIGIRVMTLELGGGLCVVTTFMSDDSVELTLIEEADVRVGVELDIPRAASAGAAAGAFGELQQKFRFETEAEAAAAIDLLRTALREDASFGEFVKDVAGAGWNAAIASTNAGIALGNWLIPFGDPIPAVPTYDLTPRTVRELEQLWRDHGLSTQAAGGVYGRVSAEFELNAGLIEAELDAAAESRIMMYDVDIADADTTGAVGRTGMMVTGSVSFDADGRTGMTVSGLDRDIGGHAAVESGYVLDLHHVDDTGTYLTVTLNSSVAAGGAMDLIDLAAAEIDLTSDRTGSVTLVFTVPVNADTSDAVGDIGVGLARGELAIDDLRALYDLAEIDVTITTGTATTTEVEIDAGVVTVDATVTSAEETTQVALHKVSGRRAVPPRRGRPPDRRRGPLMCDARRTTQRSARGRPDVRRADRR